MYYRGIKKGLAMSRKLPPLNALRAFEAAARLLSFTDAARELFVTHGAVSQQIKTLEDFFGQPLFVRSHGKVSLNAAGLGLLPVIRDSLDAIEQASSKLLQDPSIEILTVNVTTSFASHWLLPRLGDFQQRFPDIAVHLSPSHAFPVNLGNEVDVAIRWGVTKAAGVAMEKLFDVDTFVACAPSLLQADQPLLKPADLKHHVLIHDDEGQAWQTMLKALAVDNVDSSKGLFYADSGLSLQVAIEGKGVMVAGSILAADDLSAGRLVIPFYRIIPHRKDYNLYYTESSAASHKIQCFRTWLHQQALDYQHHQVDYSDYVL
jgi:LysR family glycine cleavage system transcriptional activator